MKTNIYVKLMLVLTILVALFHLGILVKLIPYDIAWGGRITGDSEMIVAELISIVINVFLISVLLIKGGYAKINVSGRAINAILWVYFFVFALNTIGNILASTTFEKWFALLTLVLAILNWKLLIKKKQQITS